MAKKTRNYKGWNKKRLNKFLSDIIGATNQGSRRAMVAIAQRGIHRLVNNVAGFSDYTGVLINSYQAAIFQKGEFRIKGYRNIIRGDFSYSGDTLRTYGNVFRNTGGSIVLLTSYNVGPKGTRKNPISYKTVKNKKDKIAKSFERNSRSKDEIPNYLKKFKRTKKYQGYGRETANIKGYSPSVKLGFEVVFDNPTPYAEKVQRVNKGSRVMPTGVANIMDRSLALSITSSEISREFIKRNKK
jgi:hypothetical protein